LTAGAWHLRLERLPIAEQRAAAFIRWTRFMRLPSVFCRIPTPTPLVHVADDSLTAIIDSDVLHPDGLLTGRAVSLEGLNLGRECAGELGQHVGSAVLLGNVLDVVEAPRGINSCE
jgi:hypothetical protein